MRNLSKEEREDARRLKNLWLSKQDALNLSQVKAAKELGYNSQGAISQYINGKVSLNFQAAAKFAKLLRVEIKEIAPRFAHLVSKPTPIELDDYVAPALGKLGGVDTALVLGWFAFHKDFAASLGVAPENLKLVRLDDESFREFESGTVLLVDDREQQSPVDGIYIMQDAEKIVARRVTCDEEGLVLSSGVGKTQQMTRDVFVYLRILGRVISVLKPV